MDAGIVQAGVQEKTASPGVRKDQGREEAEEGALRLQPVAAMRWSKEIWQEPQGKWAIENCFRHTGIVFNGVDEMYGDSNDTTNDEDVNVDNIIIRASQLSLKNIFYVCFIVVPLK
ncbi:unnamed protein product [Phytophthora fragariaefolia]|uniref:Unnamed protein product n=1 Tax=Phytophthora fragariaefolia TaxID=1490495 RepID=A0A9W7CUV8_9STRA|nr:unnamed protein product [Phytophthora fragariaefolia]